MTIIVAFILDAFVFRMNYSRKNREPLGNPEGGMDFYYILNCVLSLSYRLGQENRRDREEEIVY